MFYCDVQQIFSLLQSIKYTYNKTEKYDYSSSPRPCHNFVFMLEGQGEVQSKGKNMSIKAGDILFIPKNTLYNSTWIACPRAVFHSLHFDFKPNCDPLINQNIDVQKIEGADFSALYSALKDFESNRFSKDENSFLALSSFYSICGRLLKKVKQNSLSPINKTISPAIKYIEQNLTKQVSVEHLSSLCFLSPSRFYYLFKKHVGISPIAYKNKLLIHSTAREILFSPDLSIYTVAEKFGFSSIVYFERLFKKIMGVSPREYRKNGLLL